jgi:hypothetical protein
MAEAAAAQSRMNPVSAGIRLRRTQDRDRMWMVGMMCLILLPELAGRRSGARKLVSMIPPDLYSSAMRMKLSDKPGNLPGRR